MKRTISVDIYRAVALFMVLLYHSWTLTGNLPFRYDLITMVVSLGGEIGVTAFFLLSGYGIYCSINTSEQNGGFHFFPFMKKRCKKIVPLYYFSILFAVLFLYGGMFFSGSGIKNILAHLLFIHNLFPSYHGSINGVLWTMGVIFQFYLISYPLYKGTKRWGLLFALFCVCLTIAAKAFTYSCILPYFHTDSSLAFMSGRQLLTALDNFSTGMFVAYLIHEKKFSPQKWTSLLGMAIGVVYILAVCFFGIQHGIHTNTISGYTWHSLLAVGLGIVMFFCASLPCSGKNPVARGMLWISKYEYGIYIFHLLMMNNLLEGSEIIQKILNSAHPKVVYLVLITISVFVGYFFQSGFSNMHFSGPSRTKKTAALQHNSGEGNA